MPLTAEDVHRKQFTTVRLREGYDIGEVDAFLDEIEAELRRVEAAGGLVAPQESPDAFAGNAPPGSPPPAEPAPVPEPPEPEVAELVEVAEVAEVAAPPAATPPAATPPAVRADPPHEAAAKVLALAQRTADELLADSHREADALLADVRARTEQLEAQAQQRAAQVDAQTRERTETLDRELAQRRTALLDQLESERSRLEREVETLRAFEREYRSRLEAYFEGQLAALRSGIVHDEEGEALGAPAPAQEARRPASA